MKKAIFLLTLLSVMSSLSACGVSAPRSQSEPRVNAIAFRQLAPEPVYNRLRWVHPPEILPPRDLVKQDRPRILPVLEFTVQGATLEEAGLILAASSRYSSYCASTLVKKRVDLQMLGTVDEIAQEIAKTAKVRVEVDHEARSIRILPIETSSSPKYYQEDSPKGSQENPLKGSEEG